VTSKKLVVQFVTRSDTIGGVHTHIIDLCLALRSRGDDVIVLAGASISGIFFKKLDELCIPYSVVPCLRASLNPHHDIKALFSLISLLHILKPKYVCIHSSKAGILGRIACLYLKIPCIFTVHGWSFYVKTSPPLRLLYITLEFFLQFIPRRIILVSYADYSAFRTFLLIKKNVCIIYNSSNMSHSLVPRRSNSSVKLLSVARFDRQKDHKTLLKALSLLPPDLDWQLSLVGDGPLLLPMKKLAETYFLSHKVHFIGFNDSPSDFFASSDCFILSSNWEGLPITIIEALSACLPVIATDVGGCNELVLNGYNGFLVPPHSSKQLALAIQLLIKDAPLRSKMSFASKKVFGNIFSFERFIDSTLLVYKSIDVRTA
jgi:glycosyltransferase involved in cell wall biosynthesis